MPFEFLQFLLHFYLFLQFGPVVSEIRDQLEIAPPPPSGARYKNTPVGRGLSPMIKFSETDEHYLQFN